MLSLTTYSQARSQAEGLLNTSYWDFAVDHPSPSSVYLQMAIMLCNSTTCGGGTILGTAFYSSSHPCNRPKSTDCPRLAHYDQPLKADSRSQHATGELRVIVRCDPPCQESSHTRPLWRGLPELCCTAVAPHSVMQLRRGDELQALTAPGQLKGMILKPCHKPHGGGYASAECVKPHMCFMKPGNPLSPVTDIARSSAIPRQASPPG